MRTLLVCRDVTATLLSATVVLFAFGTPVGAKQKCQNQVCCQKEYCVQYSVGSPVVLTITTRAGSKVHEPSHFNATSCDRGGQYEVRVRQNAGTVTLPRPPFPGDCYFTVQSCKRDSPLVVRSTCGPWENFSIPLYFNPPPLKPVIAEVTTIVPETCISGFVWRQVTPKDLVCVTPQVREQIRADNGLAAERRVARADRVCQLGKKCDDVPCKSGFVWREAVAGDYVCVTPAMRAQVQADNRSAAQRRVGR